MIRWLGNYVRVIESAVWWSYRVKGELMMRGGRGNRIRIGVVDARWVEDDWTGGTVGKWVEMRLT